MTDVLKYLQSLPTYAYYCRMHDIIIIIITVYIYAYLRVQCMHMHSIGCMHFMHSYSVVRVC